MPRESVAGRCRRCGRRSTQNTCSACARKDRESKTALRNARREAGLCVCGRPPAPGRLSCEACIDRAQRRRDAAKEEGRCSVCKRRPAAKGFKTCEQCLGQDEPCTLYGLVEGPLTLAEGRLLAPARPVIKLGMTTWALGSANSREGMTPQETVASRYRGRLRELPGGGWGFNTTSNPSPFRIVFAFLWPSRQSERVLVANLVRLADAEVIPPSTEWFVLDDRLQHYITALQQQDNVIEFNRRFPRVPSPAEWDRYRQEQADG